MTSFFSPDLRDARTMFHSKLETPATFQFQMLGAVPTSVSPCIRRAGNSSRSLDGRDRKMEASVLANLRPSGPAVVVHWELLHTYWHPMMKKGLSMSYILTGPEVMRPWLVRDWEQTGQEIPLNTNGWGSQYRKRCSEDVRTVEVDAVREK